MVTCNGHNLCLEGLKKITDAAVVIDCAPGFEYMILEYVNGAEEKYE
jgi:hypothetical protein